MMLRAFAALLLCLAFAADAEAPNKPMVVLFTADWCYNCKILLPKLAQAQKGYENDLLFVKLDSTDDTRKAESRERAKSLGIGPLWFSNHATGWAALFDANHQRVGQIDQNLSVEELRASLAKLAGRPLPETTAPLEPVSASAPPT